MKNKTLTFHFAQLCFLIALISFTHGSYLFIKAQLAQYLLELAWQQQIAADEVKENRTFKPWPWADIYPVAKLRFERLNISQIVLNNDSGQALAFGPGLNRINVMNGGSLSSGIYVISAHNDSHFKHLSELKLNDRVKLTLNSGEYKTLNVNKIAVIDTQIEQLILPYDDATYDYNQGAKTSINELVLVTCYPFNSVSNSTSLRYLVYLS